MHNLSQIAGQCMPMMLALVLFSLLMVAVPLGAFFSTWHGLLDDVLNPVLGAQLLEQQRIVVAGALGVLGVNAVIATFVAAAWLERPPPQQKGGKAE